VKAGARIDGATIPRPFWTVTGGPYDGPYRKASVIHDWYCDVRERPWQDVHQMFYDAMIDSGVTPRKAKVMFLAVWACGPRWNQQQIDNVRLSRKLGGVFTSCSQIGGKKTCLPYVIPAKEPENYPPALTDMSKLRELAPRAEEMSVEQIKALFPPQPDPKGLPVGSYVYHPPPKDYVEPPVG
jgi:hypothetical protein